MPATAVPASPVSSNPTSPTQALDSECLRLISHFCGVSASAAQIAEAVAHGAKDDDEPLRRLATAAKMTGLNLRPTRLPLAQAIWAAREDQPLVAWRHGTGTWLLILRHSFFSVRVVDPANPAQIDYLSRRDLTRTLALSSPHDIVEVLAANPAKPAAGLSGNDGSDEEPLLPAYHVRDTAQNGHHHPHVSPVRRLLAFLQPEMHDVWTLVIFSAISGLLYLALPLAVNALISNLAFGTQAAPFMQALVVIALALFGCLLLSALIRVLQYYVAEVIQRRIFVRVAADMAYRLPRVKAESLDGVHAPEMVNRFLDVVTVQKSTALLLLNGVNIVLGGAIGLLVLSFYHPYLLSFTLFILIGIAVIVLLLGRGSIRTSIEESLSKYEVVNWLEEVARYPRLFKGPGGYALATDRADQLARHYLDARHSHFRVLMRQIGGLLLLEVLASSALLVVGGWLVLSQQITLGQLVASELIVSAIVASISKLGKQFEAWYDALAAVDKLGHVVDLETEPESGHAPPLKDAAGASVSARGVSFAYPGGHKVFCDVAFDLPPGGKLAVGGAHGSGCSTLLDLLLGLWQPTAGSLSIDGLDLRSWSLEQLRESVMLVRPHDIVSGTIAENVKLGRPGVTLAEVQQALGAVGMLDAILALPQGMHTPLITGGLPLPNNLRMRLLIARALVQKPRLLLLDELFSGVDPANAEELTRLVLDDSHSWTVIFATHDPRITAQCDQVLKLELPKPGSHP